LEDKDFWRESSQKCTAMILIDTPVVIAWLDPQHPEHIACSRALDGCAAVDELAVSVITLAELLAQGRSREALIDDLAGFTRIELKEKVALCAGSRICRIPARKVKASLSLLSILIWEQAAALKVPILAIKPPPRSTAPRIDVLLPAIDMVGSAHAKMRRIKRARAPRRKSQRRARVRHSP
jgi:hypothetical protein